MSDRWTEITESQYAWEKEALDYLRRHLPAHEPYRAWSNFEFVAANGFVNEVDALVVGRGKLYLVEIKSRPGRLTGDQGTWTWRTESGRRVVEDNPRLLANLKAKKLKSLLQPHMRKVRMPFIEAIVFLTDPQLTCELDAGGRAGVHLRHGVKGDAGPHVLQVLFERDGDGTPFPLGNRDERPIDGMQSRAIKHAMEAAGIRRSQRHALVGDYRLESLLHETELHQDWLAHHAHVKGAPRRVRIYPRAAVPGEARAVQQRAAENEFRLLERLDHPSIPRAEGFPPSERGDCLVFRHDPDAERLDLFLERAGDALDFGARIDLLRDLAEAVQHAHGRNVHHRTLSPQTVLVSRADGAPPTVKVVDWQNASEGPVTRHASRTVLGQTLHVDLMGDRQGLLYAAPEVRSGHDADGRALDVYSLGAIAYHLFSNRAPAASVEELERRQRDGNGLEIASVLDGATDALSFLVKMATDPRPEDRPASIAEFLLYLNEVEEEFTAPRGEGVDPREARAGDRLHGGFTVRDRLGSGSTGFALLVDRDDGKSGVLKVAESEEKNDRLVREGATLAKLRHQNIVESYDSLEIGSLRALFMAQAGTKDKRGVVMTLAHRLRKEGQLSLDLLQRFGKQLLSVLGWLEDQGVSHRDIKPDNIGIADASASKALTLVLFDFSLSGESPENVRAGTVGYLDPFLRLRRPARWDSAAERYAAAVTLHEMATGQLPVWGDGVGDPAALDGEATLESARFDPSVRERLIRFFRIALAREADERFDNAEEMATAWNEVFRHIDATTVTTTTTGYEDEPDYEAALEGASLATPLAELGLSPRVLNALERLGAGTLGELLGLKPVRMWRNPGIGQKVVAEIRELRRAAEQRLGSTTGTASAPEADETEAADGHWSVKRLADQLLVGRIPAADGRLVAAALGLGGQGHGVRHRGRDRRARRRPRDRGAPRAARRARALGGARVDGAAARRRGRHRPAPRPAR